MHAQHLSFDQRADQRWRNEIQYMILRSLGPEFGEAIAIIYATANALAVSLGFRPVWE